MPPPIIVVAQPPPIPLVAPPGHFNEYNMAQSQPAVVYLYPQHRRPHNNSMPYPTPRNYQHPFTPRDYPPQYPQQQPPRTYHKPYPQQQQQPVITFQPPKPEQPLSIFTLRAIVWHCQYQLLAGLCKWRKVSPPHPNCAFPSISFQQLPISLTNSLYLALTLSHVCSPSGCITASSSVSVSHHLAV